LATAANRQSANAGGTVIPVTEKKDAADRDERRRDYRKPDEPKHPMTAASIHGPNLLEKGLRSCYVLRSTKKEGTCSRQPSLRLRQC
jgi:hypothetical protein